MTEPDQSEAGEAGSVWARPSTLSALGVLALVLVLVVVVLVRGGGTDGAVQGGAATGAPTVPSSTPGATMAGDDRVPTSAPPGVRWELYRTVALPFSAEAGPRVVDGDVAAGYQHSPTGALIASQQIAVRRLLAENWRAVTDRSVAAGAGRDAWIAARSKYGELDPPAPGQLGQVAGFRFVDYSEARAVIQFVSRFGSGRLQVITSTVSWDGQDWRLVLQPDGGESPTAQTVRSLAGFAQWGGV